MSKIKEDFVTLPQHQDLTSKLFGEIDVHNDTTKVGLTPLVNDAASLVAFIRSTHHVNGYSSNFDALEEAIRTLPDNSRAIFFQQAFPFIVYLSDNTHKILNMPIPYLKAGLSGSVTLTQKQAACILANAFLCRWPVDSAEYVWDVRGLPSINYDDMFKGKSNVGAKVAKLQMLFNYFARIADAMPPGKLVVERRVIDRVPDFSAMHKTFRGMQVEPDGSIGSIPGTLEVDFANRFIGGASISYGCVQEEIKFSICPELNVTRLFCEAMQLNEAIVMTGGEQFSQSTGYAYNLGYGGNFVDTEKDEEGNITRKTVALDALIIYDKKSQFSPDLINRELQKAYAGFHDPTNTTPEPCSSGNWGCGAFGGDKRLKAIIQWIAASASDRDIIYFTFDKNIPLPNELKDFSHKVLQSGATISQVYSSLLTLCTRIKDIPYEKVNAFDLVTSDLHL